MALNQRKGLVNCVDDTKDGDVFTVMLMGRESCHALRLNQVFEPHAHER